MVENNNKNGKTIIVSLDANKALSAHPAFKDAVEKFQVRQQHMQSELKELASEDQQTRQQEMQQEMQKLGAQLQKEALDKMKQDIQKLAGEKGYDYVFDNNLLFAGGCDITEEAIDSFTK